MVQGEVITSLWDAGNMYGVMAQNLYQLASTSNESWTSTAELNIILVGLPPSCGRENVVVTEARVRRLFLRYCLFPLEYRSVIYPAPAPNPYSLTF